MKFTLNCDMGEGAGNDEDLMPLIDLCNIACGGHAGDKSSIPKTISLAKQHSVEIGAHPSYPDRENFGRKSLDISTDSLIDSILDQLALFNRITQENQMEFHHIKFHGALYNDLAKSEQLSTAILEAIIDYRSIPILAPFHSAFAKKAKELQQPVIFEAFADRAYDSDGNLAPRNLSGSLITNAQQAKEHVSRILNDESCMSIDQVKIPMQGQTFCIHGDNPAAISICEALQSLRYVNSK